MNAVLLCPRNALTALVTGIIALGSPSSAQTDDFEAGNDDDWMRFDPLAGAPFNSPATWSFPAGAYRIEAAPNPLAPTGGPARAASLRQEVIYSDFCVMVDIVAHNPGLSQAIGIMARVQPNPMLGDTNGYTLTYQHDVPDIQISRVVDEEPVEVAAVGLPFTPDPDTTLRLVLFGHGSYLEGRIYDTADLLDPLAITFGEDTTYSSGTCGVLVSDFSKDGDGPADATFDNYAANDGTPPQLVITKSGATGVTLTWPDSALCWQLQTSTEMTPDSWFDVFTGITHEVNDGIFSLAETFAAGGPKRFWRWWLPE